VTACHLVEGDCEHRAGSRPNGPDRDEVLNASAPGQARPASAPACGARRGRTLPLTVVVVRGAGKSVVLEAWLRDRLGLRPAWLSCDARDADPVISGWR
jgi:hypothetical protein